MEKLDVEGAMGVTRYHSDFIIEALFQNKCFNQKVAMFTFMYVQHTAAFSLLNSTFQIFHMGFQEHVDIQKESLHMP